MEAFLKATLVKEAIDCCVSLNQVQPCIGDVAYELSHDCPVTPVGPGGAASQEA